MFSHVISLIILNTQIRNGKEKSAEILKSQNRFAMCTCARNVAIHGGEIMRMVLFLSYLGCFMNPSPHPVAMCFVVPASTAILITDQPVPSADFL